VDTRFCVLGWMQRACVTAGKLWPSEFATTCGDLPASMASVVWRPRKLWTQTGGIFASLRNAPSQ
jgi:hypothetical protein